MTRVFSVVVVCITGFLAASPASAGGAKIVVRQGMSTCYGQPVGGTGGVLMNWAMNEADLVLRNRLGINGAGAPSQPQVTPVDNPRITAIIDRLNKFNEDSPAPVAQGQQVNGNRSLPTFGNQPAPTPFPN